MAVQTVFYSWQTDSSSTLNRNFIEGCLKNAIKNLNREGLSELLIDRDTRGVPGMPDIGNTLLEKIQNAAVVVADLSIINPAVIRREEERPVPNPNVLFELGYAFGKLGPQAIVGVFNATFGAVEELPFDVRPKRLLSYRLAEGEDKTAVRKELMNDLAQAIKLCLGDTEVEKIDRNTKVNNTLTALVMFNSEIEGWHGLEGLPAALHRLQTNIHELSELMAEGGFTPHAISNMKGVARDLKAAAGVAINAENWPALKSHVSNAALMGSFLLNAFGYKLNGEEYDQADSQLRGLVLEIDSLLERLRNGEWVPKDLEQHSWKLRRKAFAGLVPQHPKFSQVLKEITLEYRQLILRWLKLPPGALEAVSSLKSIRDRCSELLARYAPSPAHQEEHA